MLRELSSWGISRFSVSWYTPHSRTLVDRLEAWGYEVNVYGVHDLESFLQAVLLLPRSVTADINFPEWDLHGTGSGTQSKLPWAV